jgi:hypothetical protein
MPYTVGFMKKEATYGIDAVPTVAVNAILSRNMSIPKVKTDQLDRQLDLNTRGRRKSGASNPSGGFNFEVELAGSGAAGTAPPWMVLNEAAGMSAPVLTAATSAVQKFALPGAAISSLSAYIDDDGERFKFLGCRGDLSGIDFSAGQYPFLSYEMMGMLAAVPFDNVAMSGAVLGAWKDPIEVNTDNSDFFLGGFAGILAYARFEANAEIKLRNLVNGRYIQRGDHAMTGKIMIERPTLAAQNYYQRMINSDSIALQIVHGTVAGNILQMDAANVQILDVRGSKQDDVPMLELDVGLNAVAGGDDLVITAR